MKERILIGLIIAVFQIMSLYASNAFKLIEDDRGATIYYNGNEQVINTAIEILIEDSKLVSGNPFSLTGQIGNRTIVVGIQDKDTGFKELMAKYKINASDISNKWEAFKIECVESDGNSYLFVIGSDARGAAYGVMEISRQLGITPWVWWADAVPEKKKDAAFMTDGKVHAPSVQYRGIFLNDEDWALMLWSTRTFEPTPRKGAIGPKTYSMIFELLLRLRANTIWPAMHECTVPFFFVEGNKEAAGKYGIILGTSHAEPMMRTNTGEWDHSKYGDFNYLTNREQVLSYWEERVKELTQTENIYTIGMRGIHDGRMQGVNNLDDETQTLHKVIEEQRTMLKKHNAEEIAAIPQIFVPYKEVLKAYNNGLQLPDDVTLVWCDDNHGYIMRLSDEHEKNRSGGAGVYYHVSYWGKPHDYLWLGSTQPGLIYAEMKRAWDNGARRLWILNVGDIKPNEYLTEFFLDMAWDIDSFSGNTIYTHQQNWIKGIFGDAAFDKIDHIKRTYYLLAGHRKPEHMGWNHVEDRTLWSKENPGGLQPVKDSELSLFCFGDEMAHRIEEYEKLVSLSEEVMENGIPSHLQPAYFQLVHYPVAAASAMSRKMLYAQRSRLYAEYKLPVAEEYAARATNAYNEIAALDYTYNKDMLRGKWELMMDMKPRDLPAFQSPVLPGFPESYDASGNDVVIWVENSTEPVQGNTFDLPHYSGVDGETFQIVLHTKAKSELCWHAIDIPPFIEVKEFHPGAFAYEKMLTVSIQAGKVQDGSFRLSVNGGQYTVHYRIGEKITTASSHTERNGMIALNAFQYTNGLNVEQIEGLGHSGSVVRLPVAKKINASEPYLEYTVNTHSSGHAWIKIGTVPKHPLNGGNIRYAIIIDNQKPQVVSSAAEFLSSKWADNVLRNQSLTVTDVHIDRPGEHRIRIYALDEEVLFDQLMLEFAPAREHYLIPVQ